MVDTEALEAVVSGHTDCGLDYTPLGGRTECLANPPNKGYVWNGSPYPVDVPLVSTIPYTCQFTLEGEELIPDPWVFPIPQICQRSGELTRLVPTCYYPEAWGASLVDPRFGVADDYINGGFHGQMAKWSQLSVSRVVDHNGTLPFTALLAKANFLVIPAPPLFPTRRRTEMMGYQINHHYSSYE
eukprot:Selendium_serpulae@DN5995_c0_g1_i1.p1